MKLKAIIKLKIIRKFLGWLIYLYLQLVYKTSSWEIIKPEGLNIADLDKDAYIYAFWHGRLAMVPYLYNGNGPINVLISSHSDGDIIKNAITYFGFNTISGSSKKSSTKAILQILRKLKNGENIAITPDGSRGPRMRINSNIINIAKISGKKILPICFATTKNRYMNSWDRFILPFFRSKGVLAYGKFIEVRPLANKEEIISLTKALESELNNIAFKCDMMTNNQPILPE
jgi:lysophospholipid acyltransferase (LPLAT)-like uncharacterized protein